MEREVTITEAITPAEEIRVLKSATCLSLSGKSTLGFDWGCDKNSQIHLRLTSNSGAGLFNKDWMPLGSLFRPEGEPIAAADFKALFHFKSANTQGFVRAILQSEKLVSAEGYTAFLAKAGTWLDGAAVQEASHVVSTKKLTLSLKSKARKAT